MRQGEYPLWEAILWEAILWEAILWDAILWDAIWLKASLAMLQGRVFCPESPFASRLAPSAPVEAHFLHGESPCRGKPRPRS